VEGSKGTGGGRSPLLSNGENLSAGGEGLVHGRGRGEGNKKNHSSTQLRRKDLLKGGTWG